MWRSHIIKCYFPNYSYTFILRFFFHCLCHGRVVVTLFSYSRGHRFKSRLADKGQTVVNTAMNRRVRQGTGNVSWPDERKPVLRGIGLNCCSKNEQFVRNITKCDKVWRLQQCRSNMPWNYETWVHEKGTVKRNVATRIVWSSVKKETISLPRVSSLDSQPLSLVIKSRVLAVTNGQYAILSRRFSSAWWMHFLCYRRLALTVKHSAIKSNRLSFFLSFFCKVSVYQTVVRGPAQF